MNNLLSFIWPQTRKVNSDYNGVLEITLINGRKVLNSKNANYSFGSLQRILEIGLNEFELTNINSILLLGLGGGSVIKSLRDKYKYKGKIVAIEIDAKIIEIAKEEFSISNTKNLTIINHDAFDFVKNPTHQFDLIIVDLFINNKVPEKFYSTEFCDNLARIIEEKSSILFNLGMNQESKEKEKLVNNYFNQTLKLETILLKNILNTNTLLVINKTLV